jgi:hypothetical protein
MGVALALEEQVAALRALLDVHRGLLHPAASVDDHVLAARAPAFLVGLELPQALPTAWLGRKLLANGLLLRGGMDGGLRLGG